MKTLGGIELENLLIIMKMILKEKWLDDSKRISLH